ncbi:MAG: aspartate carbamoyltransferase [Nanoarchaeota archaeon]
MNFKGRDIISIRDFSKEEILFILERASFFDKNKTSDHLKEKVMATLFFEPSTRTRLSFETSMAQLGGKVLSFDDVNSSSIVKGESLHDTVKMVEGYCDLIVVRHPKEGAARYVAEVASVPVINAGDGSNQHPSQTFTDLYTLQKELGDISKTKIGFVGDLKYGRTVHSLSLALAKFGLPIVFISPKSLRMPQDLIEELQSFNIKIIEEESIEKVANDINILYVTRIQKERFSDLLEYERLKGVYQIDLDLTSSFPHLKIMHPLPRVGEISPEVDGFEGAIYFRQAHNGVPVRKALISMVLGK